MSILARVFVLLAFLLCAFIGISFIAKVHNDLVRWVAEYWTAMILNLFLTTCILYRDHSCSLLAVEMVAMVEMTGTLKRPCNLDRIWTNRVFGDHEECSVCLTAAIVYLYQTTKRFTSTWRSIQWRFSGMYTLVSIYWVCQVNNGWYSLTRVWLLILFTFYFAGVHLP